MELLLQVPDFKELRQYFDHLDKQLDLRKDCSFNSRVSSAHWDDSAQQWTVTAGNTTVTCRHVIFCLGFASKVNIPKIAGMDNLKARSSTLVNGMIDRLHGQKSRCGRHRCIWYSSQPGDRTYRRAPNRLCPHPELGPSNEAGKLDASAQEAFKDIYPEIFEKRKQTFGGFHYDFDQRETLSVSPEEREKFYEELWRRGGFHFWLETFHDLYANKEANKTAYDFWQKKTAKRIKDPKKREGLVPTGVAHTFGTVRPSLEQNYYEVMNQDNVEVLSSSEVATRVSRRSLKGALLLESGREIELDQIILATGFDTHTGGFKQIDIRGKDGLPLTEKWAQGCNSLNGLNTAVSLSSDVLVLTLDDIR